MKIVVKLFILLFVPLSVFAQTKQVTLQLHWKHQFQYAGFYAAVEKGFYKKIGLDVKLREWNPSINKLHSLRQGESDFIISASDKLGDVFKSKDLQIVAGYLQKSPLALAVKPDIYFPSDLKNKKIMAVENGLDSSLFYSMWKSSSINPHDLNIVPHNFNLDSFIAGEVDAIQVYITDQTYQLASKNIQFNIIDANSYGVDFYDLILLTTKALTQKNPDLVLNFKEATNKGWKYALENKEEIVQLILDKYNSQKKTKEQLLFEANRLEHFILPGIYPLGSINAEKLKKVAMIYLEMGSIKTIDSVENYIFSYKNFDGKLNLTNEEKEYLKSKKTLKVCSLPDKLSIKDKQFYKTIDKKIVERIFNKLNINGEFIKTKTYQESVDLTASGNCDILSITRPTPEREKALNIAKPFLVQPLVMVAKNEILFVDDFSKLKNKIIAISHGHKAIPEIKRLYPNLSIIEVKTPKEGLEKVEKNHAFGYVDIPIRISHNIKQEGLLDLKIVGSLNILAGLSIAASKKDPLLIGIIEKSMDLISEDYITTLINEWYAIKYEKGIDYTLVWEIGFFSAITILLMIYWNQKIQKNNILLEKTQKQLKEKNNELEKISTTDRLTGLYNRHKLDEILKKEKDRSKRYNHKFGVVIMDIDNFKQVNDNFGHNIGDNVLKETAGILKNTIRSTDHLGRWGGEEFIIICPESCQYSIKVVAEKCRAAIENHRFNHVNNITASFGVSIYNKEYSIQTLIHEADQNLYTAKEKGKNLVVW